MTIEQVNPNDIEISDLNERQNNIDVSGLVDSIEAEGVIQPPLVRENEDGVYEAFIGQRRILASREVGLETIPVRVENRGDESALKASIIENADLFSDAVSSADRAAALDKLWDLLDGEGKPSSTRLSEELNVPESTVRTWLEPLREEWKNTEVDPTPSTVDEDEEEDEPEDDAPDTDVEEVDDEEEDEPEDIDIDDVADDEEINDDITEVTKDREPDGPDAQFKNDDEAPSHGEIDDDSYDEVDVDDDVTDTDESLDADENEDDEGGFEPEVENEEGESINIVDALGEGKLQKIRQMTGGGEAGEDLAKRVAEEGLTNKEVEKVKTLHDRGNSIDEAIEEVTTDDGDESSERLREEVELTDDDASAVVRLAEERGTTESTVIKDAVQFYLDEKELREE